MIIIDGITYHVPVISIERTADFLDRYAERTEDGDLKRGLIGVYFNYTIAFGSTTDTNEYARLWAKLTEPVEFHTVTVPDEGGDYTFTAYFAGVKDRLRRIKDNKNYWTGLSVNFKAKTPARSA